MRRFTLSGLETSCVIYIFQESSDSLLRGKESRQITGFPSHFLIEGVPFVIEGGTFEEEVGESFFRRGGVGRPAKSTFIGVSSLDSEKVEI
jgi:hypothetical protein